MGLFEEQKFCRECGTIGYTKKQWPGSFFMELVLWCFFIVPGLLYSLWRISARYPVCRTCGSRNVIPVDSPVAQKLLKEGAYGRTTV